jgi:PAS domain S-box-containing protein
MLRIGTRLGIGIGVLLALCVAIGVVSYVQTQVVRKKVEQITQVSEPVNSAVYALENNLVETAFATLGYLSTGDTSLLVTLAGTRENSLALQQKFAEAAIHDMGTEERENIHQGFVRFQRAAEEQIRLHDLQAHTMDQLFHALDSTDALLTERIQASVSLKDPIAFRRIQTVLEMKGSVDALTKAVGEFLLTGNSEFEHRVLDAEGDFNRHFTTFQSDPQNSQDLDWTNQLHLFSGEIFRLSRTMIGFDKESRSNLAEFLAIEREFAATLFDRIQSRTEVNLEQSKQDVVEAGERANTSILLVLLFSIAFGTVAGAVTTKSITGPIRELALVMQGIARGDQAQQVTLHSSGELHSLGEAFNLMTGRLVQANDSLRESELRFRTIFEDAPVGIAISDDAGRLIQTNPALREMLGTGESELSEYALFGKIRASGTSENDAVSPDGHTGDSTRFQQDLNLRRNDGSIAWINVNVSPMHSGPDRASYSIMMMEDITARRATETRMRMLAHTVTSLNESVVITDAKNVIVSVNPAFVTMYGYAEEEVIGKSLDLLGLHDTGGLSTLSLKEMMLAGKWSGVLVAARKGGEELSVLLSTSVVRDDSGSPIATVSISRDIGDQMRLQRQLQEAEHRRMAELRRFADSVQRAQEEERARISRELHDDICQRLTGMKFTAEVIADDLRPGSKKVIRSLREFAGELDTAISEVRRISSNLRPSVLDDFGLVTALKMLCKEFETLHPIRATCDFRGATPRHVDPDVEIAMYRIAQEALSNVAKHSGASTALLHLHHHGSTMQLTVEDNGGGFATAPTFHQRDPGHGLGLIGMRERTELLGGHFEVASTPDKGTTVSVTVPLRGTTSHEEDTNSDSGRS